MVGISYCYVVGLTIHLERDKFGGLTFVIRHQVNQGRSLTGLVLAILVVPHLADNFAVAHYFVALHSPFVPVLPHYVLHLSAGWWHDVGVNFCIPDFEVIDWYCIGELPCEELLCCGAIGDENI